MTNTENTLSTAERINEKALHGLVKITSSDLQDLLNQPNYSSFNVYKFIAENDVVCTGGLKGCAGSALEHLENNPALSGLTLDLTDASCDVAC